MIAGCRSTRPLEGLRRVVVLGARGFLAAATARTLRQQGWPVRTVSSAECDLTTAAGSQVLAGIVKAGDCVLFTSAITRDRGNDWTTFAQNIAMAQHVIAAVGNRADQLIYLSSDAVYGSHQHVISDATDPEPDNRYGIMHFAREEMLRAAVPSELLILRLSIVYGPSDTHRSYGPNRFARELVEASSLTLFGAGEERRDHVYVDDVVEVIRRCAIGRLTGTAIVATGRSHSFAEVATMFRRLARRDVAVRSQPRRDELWHRQFATTALAAAFPDLEWTPIEQGIQAMLAGCQKTEAV